MSVFLINSENELEDDSSSSQHQSTSSIPEASQALIQFWPKVTEEIKAIQNLDVRCQALPLARIKKIMKLDDEVKMISGEAPVLFAKAAELFIQELTLRSWIHTEDNKRRTLQRNDIAMAVTKYDQFDFLIDIVPREETNKPQSFNRAGMSLDQVQYYFQLNQQSQHQQQQQQPQPQPQQPQVIHQPTVLQTGDKRVPATGSVQFIQQVVSPTGEVQQIPLQLSAAQLQQMVRMQLDPTGAATAQTAATAASPGIIIQPHHILVTQAQTATTPLYITTHPSDTTNL